MPYVFWLFFQSGIFLVVCTIELGAVFSFEVQDFRRVSNRVEFSKPNIEISITVTKASKL